ncbi:MAG: hypothetical protein JXQ80_08040 [Bacteroidales bacterium]|nr:hypothetical protein [Bacteroidales bacterium]
MSMKSSMALVLVLLTSPSIAQQYQKMARHNGYRLVAHRGGITEKVFDEFDPLSIQAAIDSGYWMLEMDVRPTADHQVILHHDATLKRIYGVDKRPEELTLAELKKLRALKGGYAPVTFEEAAAMCSGKIRFMVDVKPNTAEKWFYDEINRVLQQYHMADEAYFIRNDIASFFTAGSFGFRMEELPAMKKRLSQGEDIQKKYYLFDHGNRINAEAARWCQQHNIEVCASVNIGHYFYESHEKGAHRDIEYLKQSGVTLFQIDSDYDQHF